MYAGDFLRSIGLIPAHAGKTLLWDGIQAYWGAHPRSRGENVDRMLRDAWELGSSPLTRGKRRRSAWLGAPARLIPAHAGKTASVTPEPGTPRAHPRSRGENRGFGLKCSYA